MERAKEERKKVFVLVVALPYRELGFVRHCCSWNGDGLLGSWDAMAIDKCELDVSTFVSNLPSPSDAAFDAIPAGSYQQKENFFCGSLWETSKYHKIIIMQKRASLESSGCGVTSGSSDGIHHCALNPSCPTTPSTKPRN